MPSRWGYLRSASRSSQHCSVSIPEVVPSRPKDIPNGPSELEVSNFRKKCEVIEEEACKGCAALIEATFNCQPAYPKQLVELAVAECDSNLLRGKCRPT